MVSKKDAIRLAKAYCKVGSVKAYTIMSEDVYAKFSYDIGALRDIQFELDVEVISDERLGMFLELYKPEGK